MMTPAPGIIRASGRMVSRTGFTCFHNWQNCPALNPCGCGAALMAFASALMLASETDSGFAMELPPLRLILPSTCWRLDLAVHKRNGYYYTRTSTACIGGPHNLGVWVASW